MFNSFVRRKAEKGRVTFIEHCKDFDIPRLESETFPSGCEAETDVIYRGGSAPLKLDVYTPASHVASNECFILIHGGAFVYGYKKLDQNFGMNLAVRSGIPVVNVDYTLMPESDLSQIITEIFKAMNHVYVNFGFKKYHTVGDSAGGYLAFMTAVCARSRHICHGMWVFEKLRGTVESAGMICPGIAFPIKNFPGLFFDRSQDKTANHSRLPGYAYDLKLLADRTDSLCVAVVTGEDDPLLPEGEKFKDHIDGALYYEGKNDDINKCHHVFPIAHPEWPQSVESIDLIVENALRSRLKEQ